MGAGQYRGHDHRQSAVPSLLYLHLAGPIRTVPRDVVGTHQEQGAARGRARTTAEGCLARAPAAREPGQGSGLRQDRLGRRGACARGRGGGGAEGAAGARTAGARSAGTRGAGAQTVSLDQIRPCPSVQAVDIPSPIHSTSSRWKVPSSSTQKPSFDKNLSKCLCTSCLRSAKDDAFAVAAASSIIFTRSSCPGPKNVVSATRSGRASIVACSSGEKDFCWVFSSKNTMISDAGLFASSSRRIGCRATATKTTFARSTVTSVSARASAPVALVGGLATLATTIPSSPPTP